MDKVIDDFAEVIFIMDQCLEACPLYRNGCYPFKEEAICADLDIFKEKLLEKYEQL